MQIFNCLPLNKKKFTQKLIENDIFKIIISNKVIMPKEVLSNT